MLGKHRRRRYYQICEKPVHFLRGLANELPVCLQNLARLLERPKRRTKVHHADWLQAKFKRSNDAEVSSASAHRPEKISVLFFVGNHESSVGQHHVDGEQVVDGETI